MKTKQALLFTSLIALSAVMTGCATDRPEVEHGFLTRAQNMMGNPGAQVSVHQVRTASGHEVNGRVTYVNEHGAIVSENYRSNGRDYKLTTTVSDNRGSIIQPSLAQTPWQGAPCANPIEMGYKNEPVRFSNSEWRAHDAAKQLIKRHENMMEKARIENNNSLIRGS